MINAHSPSSNFQLQKKISTLKVRVRDKSHRTTVEFELTLVDTLIQTLDLLSTALPLYSLPVVPNQNMA